MSPVALRSSAAGVVAAWGCFAGLGLLAGSRDLAVAAPGALGRVSLELFPQGWAFFTRNPREPVTRLFAYDREGVPRQLDLQAAAPGTFLGLGRSTRAASQQVGEAVAQVGDEAWQPCSGQPAAGGLELCLSELAAEQAFEVALVRPFDDWTLCGDFGLVVQDKLPWAWSRSRALDSMPSRIARIRWKCPR